MTHIFATYAFEVGILSGDVRFGASVSLFMLPILAMRVLRPGVTQRRQGDRGRRRRLPPPPEQFVRRGRSRLTGQRRWALWGSYAARWLYSWPCS